jgi:anti-anti-sigma factor
MDTKPDMRPGRNANESEGSAPYGKNYSVQSSVTDNIRKAGIKSINLAGNQLVITTELSGVFCQGVQYYDLKNIQFINNAGLASLVDLLKSLLKDGVQVQFVNVNEKIKKKIRELGLDHILICS